ncbi:MAG: DUF393 domain-containing protein [Roseobacter sp. MedPE-SW]|nr:MAG: DUF393 domain-containing protein [Roseobacter sp. MedPE-SW]
MTNTSLPPPQQLTVFYDGSCPLCATEIDVYHRADQNQSLCLVDVSSEHFSGDDRISREQALARFHVRLPDGRQVSGARGFIEVWRVLPSWRWVSKLADRPSVAKPLELVYRMFLPIRPLIAGGMRGYRRITRGE